MSTAQTRMRERDDGDIILCDCEEMLSHISGADRDYQSIMGDSNEEVMK